MPARLLPHMLLRHIATLLLASGLLMGCIPVEDTEAPEAAIPNQPSSEFFYYQDTVRFTARFADDILLDSGVVRIELGSGQIINPEKDWDETLFSKGLGGRLLETDFSVAVPEFVTEGRYNILVQSFDEGGNTRIDTSSFEVRADITPPTFSEDLTLELPPLPGNPSFDFLACRSQVIEVDGLAEDNLKLFRIGYRINDTISRSEVISFNSEQLGPRYGNSIVVPNDYPDNSLLALTLFAIDTFGLRVERTFNVLVSCDDVAPTLTLQRTSPTIDNLNRRQIPRGGTFRIAEAIAADNGLMTEAFFSFGVRGAAIADRSSAATLGFSGQANLADFFDLNFPFSQFETVGTVYEVLLSVTDSAGLETSQVIELTIVENAPPQLFITALYADNVFIEGYASSLILALDNGQSLLIEGKVEEDLGISRLEMFWAEGQELLNEDRVVDVSFEPETFVINLAEYHDAFTFQMPENASPGTQYQLFMRITDQNGEVTTESFLFQNEAGS